MLLSSQRDPSLLGDFGVAGEDFVEWCDCNAAVDSDTADENAAPIDHLDLGGELHRRAGLRTASPIAPDTQAARS